MIWILLFSIIISSLFGLDILNNPTSLNRISLSTANASLGGVSLYKPKLNEISLTHLNQFSGFYKLESFGFSYNKYICSFIHHGVYDIDETSSGWNDNGDGIPSAEEINYNHFGKFDSEEFAFLIARKLNNKITFAGQTSLNLLDQSSAIGAGMSIRWTGKSFNRYHIGGSIEDLLSFRKWDTENVELYYPFIKIIHHVEFSSFRYGIESIIESENIEHRLGLEIKLHEDIRIRLGSSQLYLFTAGLGIKTVLISFDYAFLMPNSDLPFSESHQISVHFQLDSLKKIGKNIKP